MIHSLTFNSGDIDGDMKAARAFAESCDRNLINTVIMIDAHCITVRLWDRSIPGLILDAQPIETPDHAHRTAATTETA